MAKKKGGRMISSAGLVTYYDSEDRRAITINPKTVFAATIGIAVFIYILNLLY
ncbi:preprotein translocase subunit SecG [Methanocalculus chunghsingensis]|uniref:Preprotein translocase subunit SecG n=1 Tax=Methanocalculus chunghsingensis TaxID=156457 RepID=A0A8J7W5Z7_9EURY|nr:MULTISPECIES: preprotein translocase subunit Sec61beta [Methanocalculus]MBR1368316.1 preprotein translocase subunit SecG [Methanocalculus chunghsingensis]MCP1715225.1 preprotein translocase subunit Sec61beta [Methanocalculus alkaliphilus]